LYSLASVIGTDSEIGEDFFVIDRSACSENDIPAQGVWRDVDQKRTKLRTLYRFRKGQDYKNLQELYDVQFWSNNESVTVGRAIDEFGVEKLKVSYEGQLIP
jgi:hypothetical protein